jgi:hypothetical protein
MSLRRALELLSTQLDEAIRVVLELQVHVKDEPPNGTAVIDPFAYGADDAHGLLAEARAAVQTVIGHEQPTDLERTAAALAAAHKLVLDVTAELGSLLAFEKIAELRSFGRERGGPWLPWTSSVHDGLERCRTPLLDLHRALLEAWQELAERSSAGVSVQTTNIGQQLKVPVEVASEGAT